MPTLVQSHPRSVFTVCRVTSILLSRDLSVFVQPHALLCVWHPLLSDIVLCCDGEVRPNNQHATIFVPIVFSDLLTEKSFMTMKKCKHGSDYPLTPLLTVLLKNGEKPSPT